MKLTEARGYAAQCWCHPTTSHIEMDVVLAEVVAKQIQSLVNKREKALKEMTKDRDLLLGYAYPGGLG